jgi:hypothetical protein
LSSTAVPPAVTDRTYQLVWDSYQSLLQCQYEGNHLRRQDPSPSYGSPWETPDLPIDVQHDLAAIIRKVEELLGKMHATNSKDKG